MSVYLGLKLVDATPCKGVENKCIKDDVKYLYDTKFEDGYKVIYEDGYESWSPKKVFEDSYKNIKLLEDLESTKWLKIGNTLISPHQERVITEMLELNKKIENLDKFILENSIFKTLPEDEQKRLIKQVQAMQYYFGILIERINNF